MEQHCRLSKVHAVTTRNRITSQDAAPSIRSGLPNDNLVKSTAAPSRSTPASYMKAQAESIGR